MQVKGEIGFNFKHALVIGAVAAFVTTAVRAQQAQEQTSDQAVAETIVITGTHLRATDQGALPVQTITHEQIAQSGVSNPEQLLQSVSIAVQGNSNAV